MGESPYSVSVVLDRKFGSRISELLEDGPVWVVDSPINRDSAEKAWAEFTKHNHLNGVTVFTATERDPSQTLIYEMPTIDLHHGVYSADPAYTIIRVFGCTLITEVQESLAEFGFNSFDRTDEGFNATRPLPPPLDR
jgi:hypothetical protein